MPEHFLDGAKVCAVLQKMRRKRVPQGMRLDRFVNIRFLGVLLNQLPNELPRQSRAALTHK